MTDTYQDNVSLLLHCDGADNGTVFTDTSKYAHTLTNFNGTARTSTTVASKFGSASIKSTDGSAMLETPSHAAFTFGAGDYTVEGFARYSSGNGYLIGAKAATGDWFPYIRTFTDLTLRFEWGDGASQALFRRDSSAVTADVWFHWAMTRQGDTFRAFIDGVQVGADGAVYAGATNDVSAYFIGYKDGIGAGGFNGYIDEVRFTKGVARYTTGFTAPSAVFEDYVPPHGPLEVTLPALALNCSGGGYVNITTPAMTVAAGGGGGCSLMLPSIYVAGAGRTDTHDNALDIALPALTLTTSAGANSSLSLPGLNLSVTATVTNWGTAPLLLPALELTTSGTVATVASSALTLPPLNLIGYSGAVCSVSIGGLTITADGTTGGIATAAVTLPLFELSATATAQNYGSAELDLPALQSTSRGGAWLTLPGVTFTAIGHAVVTATYEAYAVNLKHLPVPGKEPVDEMTRYTNFPFTHIVRYRNSYFGANSTGLYLLDGTTDYASPTPTAIPWAFKTAMTDFKSPFQKTVASAYFGGRLGAAATIDLHVGEDGPQTYSYATVRTDHAQNYRQVFGKGTKARYYALGASGTGTLELDDIDLDVHTLSRRI